MGLLNSWINRSVAKEREKIARMAPEEQKAYVAAKIEHLQENLPIRNTPSDPQLDGRELRWKLGAAPSLVAGYQSLFFFYQQLEGVRWCCGRCNNRPSIVLRFRKVSTYPSTKHGHSHYAFRCSSCKLTIAYDRTAAHEMLQSLNAPQIDKHFDRYEQRLEQIKERVAEQVKQRAEQNDHQS